VATITLSNTTANIAILTALIEENAVNGSYQIAVNVPAIGNIPANDYVPTAIDSVNRTITFGCVAANGSGAVSSSCAVMPFRIVGSTTAARIFPMQGMTLVAANDANSYHISGLRRRGYMQGHSQTISAAQTIHGHGPGSLVTPAITPPPFQDKLNEYNQSSVATGFRAFTWNSGPASQPISGTTANATTPTLTTDGYTSDGINGSPNVAKVTEGPALSAHYYIHAGRML
jgi:hypothetical protein